MGSDLASSILEFNSYEPKRKGVILTDFQKIGVGIYNYDCPNGLHKEFIETISQISSYIYSPSLPRLDYTLISNRQSYGAFSGSAYFSGLFHVHYFAIAMKYLFQLL